MNTYSGERVVRNVHRPKTELTPQADTLLKALAGTVKAQIRLIGVQNLRCKAEALLNKLRLLDEHGMFLVPELETIKESILPSELKLEDIDALADGMAAALIENEFATVLFAKASQQNDWSGLNDRFVKFGPDELPVFVAYSVILQNLTKAMFDDVHLVSACLRYWLKIASDQQLTKHMSIPLRVKYESIMFPAKKYSDYVLQGECPKDFARFLLPLNIMEAVFIDLFRGNAANAYAGYVLAKHSTGITPNPKTGAGFTTVINGAIATGQDLVESWDDLYQMWNGFFMATFGTTYLVKLLIPQVSDYHGGDKPGVYAYNRVLALIVNLFLMTFDETDINCDLSGKTRSVFENKIFFKQKNLFELWGKVNRESAMLYSEMSKQLKLKRVCNRSKS